MVLILPFWEQQPSSSTSTFALFGVQYNDLKQKQGVYMHALIRLLQNHPVHLEFHLQAPDSKSGIGYNTFLIVSYWYESKTYREWWSSSPVQHFWSSTVLADEDAGVWREILTVSSGRFMHTTGQETRVGFALAPELKNLDFEQTDEEAEHKKYWGIYRQRLPDWRDDPFESAFGLSLDTASNRLGIGIDNPSPTPKAIRHGSLYIPHGIDNLLWVHEYQDYTRADTFEQAIWNQKISAHAESWINHLDTQRIENGILSFSRTISAEPTREDSDVELERQKSSQFMYFLDISHFEASGKRFRDHRQARSAAERLYRPSGQLGDGRGQIQLMVEMAVLKARDLEAEYVGCREGTGLMSFEKYFL